MKGKYACKECSSFPLTNFCILTHIDSWLPLPNTGPCHKSHFTLPAAKVKLAVTMHAVNRCVLKVEHSMQLRQLITTSSCVDHLPNVVCYMAVYPDTVYHMMITWREAIWCYELPMGRGSWWYMFMFIGHLVFGENEPCPKPVFYFLHVEHRKFEIL